MSKIKKYKGKPNKQLKKQEKQNNIWQTRQAGPAQPSPQ